MGGQDLIPSEAREIYWSTVSYRMVLGLTKSSVKWVARCFPQGEQQIVSRLDVTSDVTDDVTLLRKRDGVGWKVTLIRRV
jgi:hypothetical protein